MKVSQSRPFSPEAPTMGKVSTGGTLDIEAAVAAARDTVTPATAER